MIEINLLPDVKIELLKAQKIRSRVITFSLITTIVSLSIVAVLAVYIFTVQMIRSNMADDVISQESEKLLSVSDLSKTLTIQNQLSKISEFNSKKNISSRIFDMLAVVVPPYPNNVTFSSVNINTEKKVISLDGQAPNGYLAVEAFRKTLERTQINYTDSDDNSDQVMLASDISVGNMSYGKNADQQIVVRFSMNFVYEPVLFSQSLKTMKYSIIGTSNVTDSFLGLPTTIFEAQAADIEEGEN